MTKAKKQTTDIAAAMKLLCWWAEQGKHRHYSIACDRVSLKKGAKIFEYRSHDGTPAGIALAICQAIAEAEGVADGE